MSRLADCYVRQDDFARAVPLLRESGDRIGATQYGAVTGTPYQVSGASRTTLPFLTLDQLPSVPATVNGTKAAFTFDTGATFTFSTAMAKAARVRPVATVLVNHGNGPVPSYIGVADSLRLGQIEVRNIPVLWDDVSFTTGPAGVIGTTIFYHFQTVYPCTADVAIGAVMRRDLPGAAGPVQPPAELGFGYLGAVSHEFFKPLSVTFDFTTMTTSIR